MDFFDLQRFDDGEDHDDRYDWIRVDDYDDDDDEAPARPGSALANGTLRITVAESNGYLSEYVDIPVTVY